MCVRGGREGERNGWRGREGEREEGVGVEGGRGVPQCATNGS